MERHIYEVVRPLVYGGRSFGPGETVTMSEREAVFLKAGGQIKRWRRPEKAEKPPAKKTKRRKKKAPQGASSQEQAAPAVAAEAAGQMSEEDDNG